MTDRASAGLHFPITLHCASLDDLLEEAGLEAALARALGRAFAGARAQLPAALAVGGGVALQPPHLVQGRLSVEQTANLLARIRSAIEMAARSQSLPLVRSAKAIDGRPETIRARGSFGDLLRDDGQERDLSDADRSSQSGGVREPFDPARYDRASGSYAVPSYQSGGKKQPLPVKPDPAPAKWRIRTRAPFRVTPAHFFDIYDDIPSATGTKEPNLRALHAEVLDTVHVATAWVVEVLQESEIAGMASEVHRLFLSGLAATEVSYGLYGWSDLRQLFIAIDEGHTLADKVPSFDPSGYLEERPATGTTRAQRILRPGAWLLMVFLPLPRVTLEDVVTLGKFATKDLVLRDVAELIDANAFGFRLGLNWSEIQANAGDSHAIVLAQKFTIRRKIPERTLAVLLAPQRETFAEELGRLGRVLALTDDALAPYGPLLQQFLKSLREVRPKAIAGPGADGTWPAGAAGVSVGVRFDDDLGKQAWRNLKAAVIAARADEVKRMLGLSDSFFGNDRSQAIDAFIDGLARLNITLFELLLDELERRGLLSPLLEAVRTLPGLFETIRKREFLRLASQTRYANDPRVAALARTIERAAASGKRFHYDYEKKEIWIDGDPQQKVRAAGSSADDKAGVVAEVDAFWSESSRIYTFGPELLERLSKPTRKKVTDMLARVVCGSGETLTREQMIRKAMEEAVKELPKPPEEKDLVKVTLQQSIRILSFEPRVVAGVTETYVTFQEVRRIGNEPWEPVGADRELEAYAFEQRLEVYRAKRMVSLLETLVLAEAVVGGAFLVIEVAAVSLGTLLVFVALRVVIFRFTTEKEDRTLDGYLAAALQGEVDAVGFKLASGAAKGLAQAFAGQMLKRKLIGEVGTKWITYLLRGGVTAFGVGGSEVMNLFAEDLFSWGKCQNFHDPAAYWNHFKSGFLMGLVMEFVAIPLLAPPLRALLGRAGNALEAARALRASRKALAELEVPLLKGSEEFEAALERTINRPEIVAPLVRSFRSRVADVLKTLAREYESRAYASLLDLYGPELSSEGARGLRRLLGSASEQQIDSLLQKMLARKIPPTSLFHALGGLDEKVLDALVKAGQLERLAGSPRVLAWLTRSPAAASKALGGRFASAVERLETYLGKLEDLTPDARESVLNAIGAGHPTPPELLLAAAREVGTLDAPTLVLLKRLSEADILVGRLFDRPGQLRSFAEAFGKLTPEEQEFALSLSKGAAPEKVLKEASAARGTLKSVAKQLESPAATRESGLDKATRDKARDLVLDALRKGQRYQRAILDTVLRTHARQLAALRKVLRDFAPDAIFGTDRGGAFLAETATIGDAQLGARVAAIRQRTAALEVVDIENRVSVLYNAGKRRFAFTETYVSGSAVRGLKNNALIPLAKKYPDAEFLGLWMREGLGQELAIGEPSGADIVPISGLKNAKAAAFDVPFIVAEDATQVIEGFGHDPVYIFNSEGRIVEILQPRPNETTRSMIARILVERGGP